jgi:hypothetical protein
MFIRRNKRSSVPTPIKSTDTEHKVHNAADGYHVLQISSEEIRFYETFKIKKHLTANATIIQRNLTA